MVSLKRTPKKGKTELGFIEDDKFPVSLHISNEELTKLSLGDKDVGDMVTLTLKMKITSKSEDERIGDKKHTSMRLEAHEGEVVEKKAGKSQAETLFGK